MSLFNRRIFLLSVVAATGCGFRPMHGEAGKSGLRGQVALREAQDPETYAYRERLRRRFGNPGSDPRYTLDYELRFDERGVAVTPTSDTTRYQVTGTARYRLIDLETEDATEGEMVVRGAYDATAAPFATLAAQRDERKRIAVELAERTATRLAALALSGS